MEEEKLSKLFAEYNRAINLAQNEQHQEAALILRKILPDFKELYKLTGKKEMLMMCLAGLASVTSRLQDVNTAIADTENVIEFAKLIGDLQREQTFTKNLTKLYLSVGVQVLQTGDLDNAMEIYEKTRELAEKTGDYRDKGRCIGNLATIQRMKGNHKLAIELHEEALKLFKDYGYMDSYAMEYCNMANSYLDIKQFQRASNIFNEVLMNYKELIQQHTLYSCIKGISICAHRLENWSLALEYYEIAKDLAIMNNLDDEVKFLEKALQLVIQKASLDS